MEKAGIKFRNKDGFEQPLPRILADSGINVARIRMLKDPKPGECCNMQQAVELGKRLDDVGIGIQLDFHFSDEEAHFNKQTKPANWENKNFQQLGEAVKAYSRDMVRRFSQRRH